MFQEELLKLELKNKETFFEKKYREFFQGVLLQKRNKKKLETENCTKSLLNSLFIYILFDKKVSF